MRVLVLGSGGREHALAWKLAQSPEVEEVFLEPGNAGTREFPSLQSPDKDSLAQAAKQKNIGLVVIGPEALLADGYADFLREKGFSVLGPSREGAQLETSKIYAKEFMVRAGIPTAGFKIANDRKTLLSETANYPKVYKFDGLAAGKGVAVVANHKDAEEFADRIFGRNEFGTGRVLIEDFIPGVEMSYLGFCDGVHFVPLSSSTDHKRVGEKDTGPNTGGMGVISPSPYHTPAIEEKIQSCIVTPLIAQMKKEGMDYRGLLYIGLMIDASGNPFVIEFNVRFGDPETQCLLLRMKSDLFPLCLSTAKKKLENSELPVWDARTALFVVAAAPGYPVKPQVGAPIEGNLSLPSDTRLFYAGVKEVNGKLVTGGGRVLGIGGLGNNRDDAAQKVYGVFERIHWTGIHYRKDIGITYEQKEKKWP